MAWLKIIGLESHKLTRSYSVVGWERSFAETSDLNVERIGVSRSQSGQLICTGCRSPWRRRRIADVKYHGTVTRMRVTEIPRQRDACCLNIICVW